MDAVILAGGRLGPEDPLFGLTHDGNKALMSIASKPMVQWILDALSLSVAVDQISLVGVPQGTKLECKHPIILVPDQGSIIKNIKAGAKALLQTHADPEACALLISADVPAITPECIDWMVNTVNESKYDVYYCVVERKVMEKRFPGSLRSYIHLKDLEVCGGDINAVRLGVAVQEHDLVEQLTASRKNPLKQASLIGFDILSRLLVRQLSIYEAEKRISRRLNLKGRVIVNPYAEVAMDVDKPIQFEIMEKDLFESK